MPAESKTQHGLMGMALAVKRGERKLADLPAGVRKKVQRITNSMTEEQLKEYTSSSPSALPRHAKGSRERVRRARSA